ncbi:MAG: hypothetical protein Q9221_007007 [Calogaya cf. arnoldii]
MKPGISHPANTEASRTAPELCDESLHKAKNTADASPGSSSNPKMTTSTVLSTNSRLTMDAKDSIICYRLNNPSKILSDDATMKCLDKTDFGVSRTATLAGSDWVFLFAKSHVPTEASKKPSCKIPMNKVVVITWHDVLDFLHCGKMPNDSQDGKDGMLGLLQTFLNQACSSNIIKTDNIRLQPILEIRSEHHQARQHHLAEMMKKFQAANPHDLQALEHYVKGLRVEYKERQDNKPQKEMSKPKIAGLARLEDCRGSNKPFPARVGKYGGGSKDVQFYYKPERKYITVFDYFGKFKSRKVDHPDLPLINIGTRSKPTYIPPERCTVLEGPDTDVLVLRVGELQQMVIDGTAKDANLQRGLSNGCSHMRSIGLKMPFKQDLSKCQVTLAANKLLASCRIKPDPAIESHKRERSVPSSRASTISQTGTMPNDSKSVPRFDVSILMIGYSRWGADEEIAKTLKALRGGLNCFNIGLCNQDPPLKVALENNKLSWKVRDDIKSKISGLLRDKPGAVVILLSSRSKPVYEYVKNLCDMELGIHSVCIDTHKLAAANHKHASADNNNKPVTTDTDNSYCFQTGLKLHILDKHPARLADKLAVEIALSDLLSTRINRSRAAGTANFIIYYKGLTEKVGSNLQSDISKKTKPAKVTLIAVNKDHCMKFQTLSPIDKTEDSGVTIMKSRDSAHTWEFLIQGHQPLKKPKEEKEARNTTLPTRYTVLHDDIFTPSKSRLELEDLTHEMQYLFASSTASTSDTLPIHYVGLLRQRMEIFLQPWYRPKQINQKKNDKGTNHPESEMSNHTIKINKNICNEMFYL